MDIKDKYKAIAVLGKPGSGKGTQSALLSKLTGFESFSSGDRFREIAKRPDDLGERIGGVIHHGDLMPHWFASFIFQEKALYTPAEDGIIFDGVARKRPEAELFHHVMSWLERPYTAVYFEVSDEEIKKRLSIRRGTQSRDDDNEEAIDIRLDAFRNETQPALDFFKEQGKLIVVNGEQSEEAVFDELTKKLGNK